MIGESISEAVWVLEPPPDELLLPQPESIKIELVTTDTRILFFVKLFISMIFSSYNKFIHLSIGISKNPNDTASWI